MERRFRPRAWAGRAAPAIALAAATAASADPGDGRHFDHYGMMGWGGWFIGPVMALLFLGLVVGAVVVVVRLLGVGGPPSGGGQGGGQEDRAHTILRERFARGEITREEYETARKVLDGETP